jgi:hypothetical protein
MAVIQKTLFSKNLTNYSVLVNDTQADSKYFKITQLPDTFTGGKNAFLIAGSEYLVPDTKIQIELRDASGNIIYHEPGEGMINTNISGSTNAPIITEYYEGVSKVVAVYVYPDTAFGPCTLTILGELSSYESDAGITSIVPLDWENKYNVKWQKQINVNPSLPNTTKIRFYQRPQALITEILSPIYRIESGSKVNSGVSQSFAEIKLSQLETFAGDVKRVKVFRTSQGDISDYDLIQDILVESKELLTSFGLSGSVVGETGIFTSETLKNYWNTGSLNADLTSNRVESGVRLSGGGNFTYTSSLDIKSANTYELNLDAFYSSSTSSNLGIYLISGSTTSSIATLIGTQPTKNLLDTVIPFKIDKDFVSASLYFSQSQGEWHVGNISLKLSQDTAFSPDEISFITTMPTIIGDETYNFKFEFYDVNNTYVPVAVTQSANFTGGNIGKILRSLTLESDRTAFRFSTGSYGNPPFQQLGLSISKTNLTGSVTYGRSVFDTLGNYIAPASYAGTYPGTLTNSSDAGATLTIANFSGSVSSVIVGSIVYTASCDGLNEFETIYRFEDGDNAPGVFVTANTNQFIYKATDLSLNPTGQVITIEAKRKNLASATTPLTINIQSSSVQYPAPTLTMVGIPNPTNGVDTYTLAGSSYPYLTGETIYYISGSDQFGNEFSDAIKISPVKILDGFSVAVTNENTSFPANSAGSVISGFAASSGSITVKVGNEVISYASPIANNKFSASISATSGLTTNTFLGTNYSINALSQDSGSLTLLVKYQDGGGTIISSSKEITYSKVKKAAPVLEFVIGNNNQSTDSTSIGTQITAFTNSSLSVKQQYDGVTSTLTLANAPTINSSSAFTPITKTTTNLTYPTMISGTDSVELSITGSVTDSEGVSRNVFGNVSLTKIKKAAPVLSISSTPKDQSVTAKSTGEQIDSFANATIVVKQTYNGSTTTLPATLTATRVDTGGSLTVNNTSGVVTLTNQTLAVGVNSTTVNISAVVTDSEGTSRTLTDTLSLSKVKKAVPLVLISASPQAQSVLANSAGTQTGTLSNVTISALEGTTSRFTSMVGTYTGFSTNPTISSNTLTMTSAVMNASEASATIVVTHTDSEGTTGQTQTIIVRATKVPTGATGDPGNNGNDGKRTATGLLYYQLAAATAPATPTATSYTFSTNAFAGLTTNWALGAPTFAAGNSNKYWYSTYTAVETTAGGNTAVPTFTTVTQAIGFTGLVTFTSPDNISDGSGNTSEIIPKGSITNHIGGANVTTINGGKISTGQITSTKYTLLGADTVSSGSYMGGGTIFNLDGSGSIRSKNFYITPEGDAFFKGTLSAPTGNIGGWSIGSTFISASRTLLKNDGVIELRNSEQSVKVTIDGGTTLPDPTAGASNISLSLPQSGPGTATITAFTQYLSTTNTVTITKTGSYRFRATISSNSQNGIVSNPDLQWMQARLYINSVERQVITGNFNQSVANYPDFGMNFSDFDLTAGDTVYIILRNDFYASNGATDIKYYVPATTFTGISNVPKVGINQEGFQIIQDSSRYFTIKPSTLDFYNNSVGAQDRKIIGTQSGPLVLNNAVMGEWHNGWQNVYHKESTIPLVHEAAGGHDITSYYWGGKNRAFQIIRAYGIIGTGVSTNWYDAYDYTNRPDYFWYNVDTVTRNGAFEYTITFVEPIYSYDTVREGTEYYSVFVGGRGQTPGFGLPWVTNISNTGFTLSFFQLEDREDAQFSFIVVK